MKIEVEFFDCILDSAGRNITKHPNLLGRKPVPNGYDTLKIKAATLIGDAVTVGYATKHQLKSMGGAQVFSFLNTRASVIERYFKLGPGSLTVDPFWPMIDASEKVGPSFLLSMALSQSVARKGLHVPALFHVRSFIEGAVGHGKLGAISNPAITSTGGRGSPDLIGRDPRGNWHIFEAKGRLAGSPSVAWTAVKKGLKQARLVATVNGAPPTGLHVVVAAKQPNDDVYILWLDPEGEHRQGADLRINDAACLTDYYDYLGSLVTVGELPRSYGSNSYLCTDLLDGRLTLGLRESLVKKLRKRPESHKERLDFDRDFSNSIYEIHRQIGTKEIRLDVLEEVSFDIPGVVARYTPIVAGRS